MNDYKTAYANQVRENILRALSGAAEQRAQIFRRVQEDPFAPDAQMQAAGSATGYRYIKRGDAARIGVPGELADDFDSEWLIAFGGDALRRGDELRFGEGDCRQVASVRSGVMDIYCICRLEAIGCP